MSLCLTRDDLADSMDSSNILESRHTGHVQGSAWPYHQSGHHWHAHRWASTQYTAPS
jgi:hypothetical protein